MTPEQFTYWIKGYFDLSNTDQLTVHQTLEIKSKLDYMFSLHQKDDNKFRDLLDKENPYETKIVKEW